MVRVTEELAVSPEAVTLYHANDPLLGHLPILAFHGPSTTANYTQNSSRIQVHIYTPAGFQSFPRLTISPNSPFYGVVSHLPREFQGDEVCRGLAFALFKYFSELSEAVKTYLRNQYPTTRGRRPGSAPALFGEQHAADLAKAMTGIENNTSDLLRVLQCALQTQHISNLDLDLVLPPGTVTPLRAEDLETAPDDEDDVILDPTLRQYDPAYMSLVKLFGDPVFLPTSKLRRAPSRPSSLTHRSKTFSKDQKVDLRMKMGELVDTEERYVLKLNDLVRNVADNFRIKAQERSATSISPTADEIDRLFPRSADHILQVNSAFMQELRRVMDDTEEDAVRDLDAPYAFGSSSSRHQATGSTGSPVRAKDPSGALMMARTFLEWFPKFTDCYQEYIRASQHFPQLLNSFLDRQSSFRDRVMQTTGEQTLRSILIEPVQRLPRYSLLIDQIVGCLPINHPALQLMLRARDIITNICSMDDPLDDKPQVSHRLRNMVEAWPADFEPEGRLVLAADFVELAPPFDVETSAGSPGVFLLFSDCLVVAKKKLGSVITGRDLLREIDKPSPAGLLASMTNAAGGPGTYDVVFSGWHQLADVRFTESADARLIWMTSAQEMRDAMAGGEGATSKAITTRCFFLQENFEGKAMRWSEDVVKARIEGRFSEAEREKATWTLRSVRLPENNNMGLHAAVFDEAAEQLVEGRREPAPVRVVLDNHKGTKGAPVGHYGVEIVVEVHVDSNNSRDEFGESRRVTMTALGLNGKRYTDDIAIEDFLPTLSRRITQLTSAQYNTANPRLVPALVAYHTKTLRSLNFNARSEKTKSFLGSSPVKLFSNFLSGGANNSSGNNGTTDPAHSPQRGLRPYAGSLPRSTGSRYAQQLQDNISLNGSIRDRDGGGRFESVRPENPLVRLEQTFTGYVAALQARKGQFWGRALLNRASSTADELAVNLLYNKLNESPFDWESSFELPPEVVFAAFEKFARIAWREQMGTIMTIQSLDALQERAVRKVPGDFADFVNFLFADMAPQNRRAFTALIKLLADLLDGCSDDGDRGAMTLAFAELLVADSGEPHNYINLLDLLVDDCDHIFDEPSYASLRSSAYESMNSTSRSQKSATGSVTSNTSSLRRKFGLESLLRQNSSSSSSRGGSAALEAMVAGGCYSDVEKPSMWRTLSKHHRNPATGESPGMAKVSMGYVSRSRSIDMGSHHSPMGSTSSRTGRRPGSRDRPPVVGVFADDMMRPTSSHRPNSAHRQLETIGEPDISDLQKQQEEDNEVAVVEGDDEEDVLTADQLGRKRRSSLSDLKVLMEATSLEDPLPLPSTPLGSANPTSEKYNTGPRPQTPLPFKLPVSPQHVPPNTQTPQQSPTNANHVTPQQKENAADPSSSLSSPSVRKGTSRARSHSSVAVLSEVGRSGHNKVLSGSSAYVATLKVSRATAIVLPPPTSDSPTRSVTLSPVSPSRSPGTTSSSNGQKLRLQSPQRLRERLQTEKQAVNEADASLKSELSRIAEDMARVNLGESTPDLQQVASSVRMLEERVPQLVQALADRQEALQQDMDRTVRATESKMRAIDQLYKEATAENELLYEKFNFELGKIVKALKGKGREDKEELVAKLKEQSEESARLKKENARLRREAVSLRTLLKGGEADR